MGDNNIYDSLYTRNNSAGSINKTVLIDSYDRVTGMFIPPTPQQAPDSRQQLCESSQSVVKLNRERKMVGVLFSVSRLGNGEIFPIYEGKNNIGRGRSNDIRLQEASINDLHAVLYAVHDDYPAKDYVLSVHDQGSSFGTMVGNDDVIFNPHTVHDGDILYIGNNYQLVVKLFQREAYNLFTSETFQSTEEIVTPKFNSEELLPPEAIPSIEFYTPSPKSQNQITTRSY